jgi:hypothetical protein
MKGQCARPFKLEEVDVGVAEQGRNQQPFVEQKGFAE